jgi:DNA segregation ATPase FtsK/SpoIIIE-like protein
MLRYVYLVRAGKEYKVGVTVNVKARVKSLQTSNARRVEVIATKQTPEALFTEKLIHRTLGDYTNDGGREWFTLTDAQVVDVCVMVNQSPDATVTEMAELQAMIQDQQETMELHLKKSRRVMLRIKDLSMRAGLTGSPAVIMDDDHIEKPVHKSVAVKVPEQTSLKINNTLVQEARLQQDVQDALAIMRRHPAVSTSSLQRYLQIGFSRASRIMDELERKGLIGPANGNHKREILDQSIIQPSYRS